MRSLGKGLIFSFGFLRGRVEGDFFLFFGVLNVFPSSSWDVLINFWKCSLNSQCVLQDFPNNTSFFIPYCLAMVQLPYIYIYIYICTTCRGWGNEKHDKTCEGSILRLLCWEVPPCSKKIKKWLLFLSFGWEGGEKDLFSFFPGSQCVPTMFLLSFQWVPSRFPIYSPSSWCVLQHVLQRTSLLSHMLWQMLPSFHLYRWWANGQGTLYIKREPSILGSLHSFIFLSDRPIKLTHCKKKRKKRE